MSDKKLYPNAIRNWPEDDRPREKMLKYGEHTLSNAELYTTTEVLSCLSLSGQAGQSSVFWIPRSSLCST